MMEPAQKIMGVSEWKIIDTVRNTVTAAVIAIRDSLDVPVFLVHEGQALVFV